MADVFRSSHAVSAGTPCMISQSPIVREELIGVAVARADEVALALVDDDRGAAALLHLAGEAVVVGVDVRDEQRLEFREADAGVVELLLERVERLGDVPAGVDERPAVVPFDEVRQHPAERVVRDGHPELEEPVHDRTGTSSRLLRSSLCAFRASGRCCGSMWRAWAPTPAFYANVRVQRRWRTGFRGVMPAGLSVPATLG